MPRPSVPVKPARTPLAAGSASAGTALLVLDMFSDWDFAQSDRLGKAACAIAPAISRLRSRCRTRGVPTVFVNDNQGRWRSDFADLVRSAATASATGRDIARHLEPDREDYVVLKPKHSAFYATPLDLLLRHLKVRRVLVTGVAGDQCVLITAVEARMRDYDVVVPGDCIGSQTARRNGGALRYLREAHMIAVGLSRSFRFDAGPPRR